MRLTIKRSLLLAFLLMILFPTSNVGAQEPIVRAVLFYSPSCPHCHEVMTEHLPAISDQYGDQLQIVAVNTYVAGGAQLFQNSIEVFEIPPERQGVPMMIIGDQVLVGSIEIPTLFPGLVEDAIEQGGMDWPAIPGLIDALPDELTGSVSGETTPAPTDQIDPTGEANPAGDSNPTDEPNPTSEPILPIDDSDQEGLSRWFARAKFMIMLDPAGNILALIVLIGMVLSVIGVVVLLLIKRPAPIPRWTTWAIPALSLVGIVIAVYLSYIEITQQTAFCGPVGDCNSVQHSTYAKLFGVVPVGLLGLAGYVAILATWFVSQKTSGWLKHYSILILMGMTFFGTTFSIYLTYLEPFVIGATCMWCVLSSVIMTAQMWLVLPPTLEALEILPEDDAEQDVNS
ncbi:MAG: vitamin K epoxide reductase family protein [Anaerolineales bacterium]|jgi:uncharacterized membrane protein/thiol-disulfide isomerase/thioredoxin